MCSGFILCIHVNRTALPEISRQYINVLTMEAYNSNVHYYTVHIMLNASWRIMVITVCVKSFNARTVITEYILRLYVLNACYDLVLLCVILLHARHC